MLHEKYKFYLTFLLYYLRDDFKEVINNLLIIIKDKKMFFAFIFITPILFYVIKIQIILGLFFSLFYLSLFILYYFIIKSDFIIKCEEATLNTNYLYRYSFFNIFLFVPKAKAFLLVYNFLNICINTNEKKEEKIILVLTFIVISFLLKFYFLIITGYTYFCVLISSNLIISYFETISWKYENKKAKNQHIVLNCLLDNSESVGRANNMKIIINDEKIIFNADKFIKFFLSKVKDPEKLQRAFSPNKKDIFSKKISDNHFSWSISSSKFKNKNLTKNKTSSKQLKVFKEDGTTRDIDCSDKSIPRLDGKNKADYLTRAYELNKEKTVLKEVPKDIKIKMQSESKYIYNSMVADKDEVMLYSEGGKIYEREKSPTIREYSSDSKISISDRIDDLIKFENSNEKYLSSDEGKKNYDIYKSLMRGNKLFIDDNSDSPYEDFVN